MSLRERVVAPRLGIIEPCLPSPAKVPPSGPGWKVRLAGTFGYSRLELAPTPSPELKNDCRGLVATMRGRVLLPRPAGVPGRTVLRRYLHCSPPAQRASLGHVRGEGPSTDKKSGYLTIDEVERLIASPSMD
jgi:hypothetical protein